MLKSLSGRSSFPNEMIYQDRLAGSDMEKAKNSMNKKSKNQRELHPSAQSMTMKLLLKLPDLSMLIFRAIKLKRRESAKPVKSMVGSFSWSNSSANCNEKNFFVIRPN